MCAEENRVHAFRRRTPAPFRHPLADQCGPPATRRRAAPRPIGARVLWTNDQVARREARTRKRPTRKQLDERLSIPLGPKDEEAEAQADAEALAASRQRVRDRAGDEPPPKGTGRPRK